MKQLKTIRDAIASGARTIYLNNGTQITHIDHGLTYDAISPPKMIKGKPVYRRVFCRITCCVPNQMNCKEIIKPYAFDSLGLDFIIPERELNLFINVNGGIDSYRTDYWNTGWLYY